MYKQLTYITLLMTFLLTGCTTNKEKQSTSNEINLTTENQEKSTLKDEPKTTQANKKDEKKSINQGITITHERHLPLIADSVDTNRSILANITATQQLSFHNLIQNNNENVTLSLKNHETEHEYTLTSLYPILIEEENFKLVGGTIKGNLIINAPGFEGTSTIEGQVVFTNEKYAKSANIENMNIQEGDYISDISKLTGFQNYYDHKAINNFNFEKDQIVNGKLQLNDNDRLMEKKYNFKYDENIDEQHVH